MGPDDVGPREAYEGCAASEAGSGWKVVGGYDVV